MHVFCILQVAFCLWVIQDLVKELWVRKRCHNRLVLPWSCKVIVEPCSHTNIGACQSYHGTYRIVTQWFRLKYVLWHTCNMRLCFLQSSSDSLIGRVNTKTIQEGHGCFLPAIQQSQRYALSQITLERHTMIQSGYHLLFITVSVISLQWNNPECFWWHHTLCLLICISGSKWLIYYVIRPYMIQCLLCFLTQTCINYNDWFVCDFV